MLKTVLMAGLALAGVATIPAHADEVRTVQVRYADLDLAHPEGVRTLNTRIAAATAAVCPASDGRNLSEAMEAAHCRKLAMIDARAQAQLAVSRAQTTVMVASR